MSPISVLFLLTTVALATSNLKKRQEVEEVVEYEDVPAAGAVGAVALDGPVLDPLGAVDPPPGETIVEEPNGVVKAIEPDGRVLLLDDGISKIGDDIEEKLTSVSDAVSETIVVGAASASMSIPSIFVLFLSFLLFHL